MKRTTIDQYSATKIGFVMIDATDHIAGKAGLTLAVKISKNGAAFADAAPVIADLGYGHYSLTLTPTDTDIVGDLAFHITAAGADPADPILRVEASSLSDIAAAVLSAAVNTPIHADVRKLNGAPAAGGSDDGSNVILATALRNSRADEITVYAGANARLVLYTAGYATALVECVCAEVLAGPAVDGVLTLNGIEAGTAVAAGIPVVARLLKADQSLVMEGLTVGLDNANIILDNLTIAQDALVAVNAATIIEGNGGADGGGSSGTGLFIDEDGNLLVDEDGNTLTD